MPQFDAEKFLDFIKNYDQSNPKQKAALLEFAQKAQALQPDLFTEEANWVKTYRKPVDMIVTKGQLAQIWNKPVSQISDADIEDLNSCLATFNITSLPRIRHFISQISHESGAGRWREELASGSDYEGRKDLGNVKAGDGVRFKGAGMIQLTGRANYQAFSDYIKDPRVMEGCAYVAKNYPFSSAGFWWFDNKMNALCDGNPTVEEVTLRVNGGYRGLEERKAYYAACLNVIK